MEGEHTPVALAFEQAARARGRCCAPASVRVAMVPGGESDRERDQSPFVCLRERERETHVKIEGTALAAHHVLILTDEHIAGRYVTARWVQKHTTCRCPMTRRSGSLPRWRGSLR